MAGKKQAGRPSQKGQGKKKNRQQSVPVVDVPDEDVALSDEDLEFFSHGKRHAFLAKLDPSKLEQGKKVWLCRNALPANAWCRIDLQINLSWAETSNVGNGGN